MMLDDPEFNFCEKDWVGEKRILNDDGKLLYQVGGSIKIPFINIFIDRYYEHGYGWVTEWIGPPWVTEVLERLFGKNGAVSKRPKELVS